MMYLFAILLVSAFSYVVVNRKNLEQDAYTCTNKSLPLPYIRNLANFGDYGAIYFGRGYVYTRFMDAILAMESPVYPEFYIDEPVIMDVISSSMLSLMCGDYIQSDLKKLEIKKDFIFNDIVTKKRKVKGRVYLNKKDIYVLKGKAVHPIYIHKLIDVVGEVIAEWGFIGDYIFIKYNNKILFVQGIE